MPSIRSLLLLALVAGPLCGQPTDAETKKAPLVTRVFYLQQMETRKASTLLRSQVKVRRVAQIPDRQIIIVADEMSKVDRSEALLRQRKVVARAVDPHEPLDRVSRRESESVKRRFRVKNYDTGTAISILRAIYQVRETADAVEENTFWLHDTPPFVEASEALLRELDLVDSSY